jgi:hypothetical protein
MARPRGKEMPTGHLTSAELKKRYNEMLNEERKINAELEEEKKELEKQNSKLTLQLKEMESKLLTLATDETEIKQILEFFSKNFSYLEIFDKMKFLGFKDITVNKIKKICTNIESLSPEMNNFFKTQQKAYIENIKISPDLYKEKIMMRYERLYSDCELDLANMDLTFDEKSKLKGQMSDIANKMNGVLKNIVDDVKEEDDQNEVLSKIAKSLSISLEQNSNIKNNDEFETFSEEEILVM